MRSGVFRDCDQGVRGLSRKFYVCSSPLDCRYFDCVWRKSAPGFAQDDTSLFRHISGTGH